LKKLILIILFCLITTVAFADKFIIPFSIYPKELQAKFKEHNIKLDLSGNDRTEDSFGFIKNEGTSYTIYTYFNATDEEMNLILDILMEE